MSIRKIFLMFFIVICTAAMAAPSPWDSWRTGYTSFEQGEALRERGRYTEAVKMFEKAKSSYLAVRAARPDWNQRVIADRLRDCEKQLSELKHLLGNEKVKKESKPEKKTVQKKSTVTSADVVPSYRQVREDNAKLTALQREVYQLKAELTHTRGLLQKQRDFEAEMAALLRDRKIAEDKLALQEKRYQALVKEKESAGANTAEIEQRLVLEKVESERVRKQLAAAEQQLNELRQKINEILLSRTAAEKRLVLAESELKRKDSEIARLLENTVKITENAARQVDSNTKAEKEKFENLAAAYKEAKAALIQREQELQQLKIDLQQKHSEANVSAVEIANLRKRNKDLENDVKLLSERVGDLGQRLERRNNEDFQAAASAKKTRLKLESDILQLQQELISLRNTLESKNAEIANSMRRIKSLEAELLAVRATALESAENARKIQAENDELSAEKGKYEQLQRDFKALVAENRENKMLAEAAKPREAELARAKSVLLQMDRLKQELAREQRLNAELKTAYSRDQKELNNLRSRSAEFDAARRRLIELEVIAKDVGRLRELEAELSKIKGREAELARVKIQINELLDKLRERETLIADFKRQMEMQKKELETLKPLREDIGRLRRSNDELRAMVANQNSELDRLNNALKEAGNTREAEVDPAELQKYRELAAQLGPLNDRLRKLQDESAMQKKSLTDRITALSRQIELYERDLQLKEKALAELKKLNADLADYRKNSTASLQEKVDESRISRLDKEVAALNKLNVEIAAERDRLQSELEKIRNGEVDVDDDEVTPIITPQEALANGIAAEKNGGTELAIWNYQQALLGDKNLIEAHLRLGILFFNKKRFGVAVPHLSQAYAAQPENLDLALMLTRSYLELKRYGNAQGVIEPLLLKYGKNAKLQMYAALTDAGSGNMLRAEERLQTALRLNPDDSEIHLEIARLLIASVADRRGEAVVAYENARRLGCDPDPLLEKELGDMLDHRRDLVRFLSELALGAEADGDWKTAVWYYKEIISKQHDEYVPYLAFALWKSGDSSRARETLVLHKPSSLGMVVMTIIALDEKDDAAALRAAQQSTGAKIPREWVALNQALLRVEKEWAETTAGKLLLRGIIR